MKYYFSLVTGELFNLPDDMGKTIDKFHLELSGKPNCSCKKCYGRFYTSYNPEQKVYEICPKCCKKLLITDISNLVIETPKTTNQIEFVD